MGNIQARPIRRPVRHAIAAAALALCSAKIASADTFYSWSGAVDPTPADDTASLFSVPDTLTVGGGTTGSFSALAGAQLTGQRILVGNGSAGVGSVSIAGNGTAASTVVQLNRVGGGRLAVGDWGIGTMTVSAGALVDATGSAAGCTGSTFCGVNVGGFTGANGKLTVTGPTTEFKSIQYFLVGNGNVSSSMGTPGGRADGAVEVLAGATLNTQGGFVGWYSRGAGALGNESAYGTALISGAGSQWLVGSNPVNGDNAWILIGRKADQSSPNAVANGEVTVENGGKIVIDGGASKPGYFSIGANGGTGSLTVTGKGSSVETKGVDPSIVVGDFGGGSASFSVLAGASATSLFLNVGRLGTTGNVTIDGRSTDSTVSSTLRLVGIGTNPSPGTAGPAFANIGRDGGTGTVTISNGGQLLISDGGMDGHLVANSPGVILGRGANSSGTMIITGVGSKVEIVSSSINPAPGTGDNYNPFFAVGNDNPDTTSGTLTISAGGKLVMTGNAVSTVANSRGTSLNIGGRTGASGTGTVTVTGAGSEILMTGYDAFINVGRSAGSTGVLNILDGALVTTTSLPVGISGLGTVNIDAATLELVGDRSNVSPPIGAGATIGRGAGGLGKLNMTNGAKFNITPGSLIGGIAIGGDQFFSGGSGELDMKGGSAIVIVGGGGIDIGFSGTGSAKLYGSSSIGVGPGAVNIGGVPSAGQLTGNGTLELYSGSKVTANVINIGGSSDLAGTAGIGGTGNVKVDGLGSELKANGMTGFIGVGRGGTGTLTVTDQGKISAVAIAVGRNNGVGTLIAQNSTLELAGELTTSTGVSGASLVIGSGGGNGPGNGTVSLVNSTVTVTNPSSLGASVNIGGSGTFPTGTGSLSMVSSQLTVDAAPGLGVVNIGRTGSGTATLVNSMLTNNNGSVYVGREAGSVGTLVMTNGSTINTGYFGAGVSAPYSAGVQSNGGTGIVVLNDSTINTGVFELGAGGILTGNNGTVDAVGDVIIGGTISPGNSPGRIRIRCNVIMLPGSRIVLEIAGSGDTLSDYQIDQLIIDDDASFDLASAEIVFNFLGETNPNVFSAIGGLNLDYYLRTVASSGSIDGPTQSLRSAPGADGKTWSELINTANVSAKSASWDVTEFSYQGDGTFALTAVPVPEPSTWGLMFVGLCAVGSIARRRRAAQPA